MSHTTAMMGRVVVKPAQDGFPELRGTIVGCFLERQSPVTTRLVYHIRLFDGVLIEHSLLGGVWRIMPTVNELSLAEGTLTRKAEP